MRKWLSVFVIFFLFATISIQAQVLQGRVLAENGTRAGGVKVSFQNKKNSISTNPDGTFKITATRLPDTLVFSAPGFEPYKVLITEKNLKDPEFEVVLLNERKKRIAASYEDLATASIGEEVVVTTAYGISSGGSGSFYEKDYAGSEMAGRASGVTIRGYSSLPTGSINPASGKLYFADTNIAPRTGMAAKSRILTAGEVNDFNKWKMWEEYTANEFKSMGNFWGLLPKERYSVQLTDKKFRALVNEAVYLISAVSGDTIWRARTDNTGKAELWAGFLKDQKDGDRYFISDQSGNRLANPVSFANGINMLAVDKGCGLSSDVDIAFVVDATGSMGDEIEFLKLELEDVIRHTMDQYKSLSLRAASVFYRDKGDEYVTKDVAFNEDLLKAINFIKLQQAGGGGDTPEAVDEALALALDSLAWNPNARTRLLFLVLDAPPHQEAMERTRALILKAAGMGIRVVPVACSGTDKQTEFLLRSIALATNGTYAFLTNLSGVGNTHIEPTTDKYEVEILGNLLERVIAQFIYARECDEKKITVTEPVKQPDNILTVKLYPNPTSGLFTIESNKEIREIFIADFTGKILMRMSGTERKGSWQVDMSQYPAGTYFVKYITAENKWGAEKVVLVR